MSELPTLGAVVPAYQAAAHLPYSLPALIRVLGKQNVLVVDAGSTDDSTGIARRLGTRILELGHRAGPAEARNAGVERMETDVVLFVDSDCVVHADVVERVRRSFGEDPELVALTGSYDDRPTATNFASLYMNLRHHFVHQHAARENASFWAGCGAVRRAAFLHVDGFDAARYPRPMIEDIELGHRLRDVGRTRLDPELQATHRKHWTVASVIRTDIVCRALPWSYLIAETGNVPDDLNLKLSARLAAVVAPLALAGVVALPILASTRPTWIGFVLLPVLLAAALNLRFVIFLARRGPGLAVGGFLFHQLHLTYSAATFVAVRLGLTGNEES